MLNNLDIQNILALISATPIKGSEAETVHMLQMKLKAMLTVEPEGKEDGQLAAPENEKTSEEN